MPHQHGVEINSLPLPQNMPTIGSILRNAGYETYYIGKWHVPRCFPQGTDEIPGFFNDPIQNNPLGEFTDKEIVDKVISYLKKPKSKPFFLTVSLQNPHDICHWIMKDKTQFLEKYSPKELDSLPPLPANFAINEEPEFLKIIRQPKDYGQETKYTLKWKEIDWQKYLYAYYRLTEKLDSDIGKILESVENNRLSDDTIIIFSSDHGEGMAEHKLVVKLQLYDSIARVPLIIRGPEIPKGKIEDSIPISGIDLLPTICHFANIKIKDNYHGISLKTILSENKNNTERKYVVTELLPFNDMNHRMRGRMLRTKHYKYIRFSGIEGEMLFDMINDKGEIKNLSNNSGYQNIIDEHRRLLKEWTILTDDDNFKNF